MRRLSLIFIAALLPVACQRSPGGRVKRATEEESAVAEIRKMNGQVEQVVVAVSLSGRRATDDGLKHLEPLKELRRLDLSENFITGAGLVHLQGLANLEELNLSYNSKLSGDA